jgi:hypothetical protein
MRSALRTHLPRCVFLTAALLGAELGCSESGESTMGGDAGASSGSSGEAGADSGGAARGGATSAGGASGRGGTSGSGGASGTSGTSGASGASGGVGGASGAGAGGSGEGGGTAATDGGTGDSDGAPTSGGGGEGGAECVPRTTGQRPLDLFLLVDRTRFLGDPLQVGTGTYFSATVAAIEGFASHPDAAGTGVALGYFPLEGDPDACAASYATPDVDVGSIPAASDELQASLAAHAPFDDASAIAPALEGAIAHMRTWGAAHPERRPVVVLLASLAEIGCTTWEELYAVAEAGFVGTPSVETAMISLLADSTRSLFIASQSMTTPFIIDSQGDVTAQVGAALLALTNPASSCQLDYPTFDPHLNFDDDQLAMLYTANATGEATELPRVASAAACGADAGWYLTDDPPRALVACPASCEGFDGGYLSARVDCPR